MRTISAEALARRYDSAQRVAWLLELKLDDWRWRGATLAVETDGDPWPARIEVGRWREELPNAAIPTGRVRDSAEVRVLDLPDASDSLRARLEVAPPLGIEATLRLMWLGDGAAALNDSAVLLRGRVVAWRIDAAGARLELIDELAVLEQRRMGRILRQSMLGGEQSPMTGKPLPWVFGRLDQVVLPELRPGAVTRLASPLTEEDRVIPAAYVRDFSPIGRIQIGAEIIRYMEIDLLRQTFGTSRTPVARGMSTGDYPKGEPVRQVPPGGFQWFVADHPCLSVDAVAADGVPLDPTQWSAELIPLGGRLAQVVTMQAWPANSDGGWAQQITVNVSGLEVNGDVVENPARVLEQLLTGSQLGALAAERLDANAFNAAADELGTRGYRFARRIAGNETLGDLIESAAREAGVWLTSGDPIAPILAEPSPAPAAAEETLDAARALTPAPARVSAPGTFLPPDSLELVGAPSPCDGGRPVYQFPPDTAESGAIPLKIEVDWLALTEGSAGDLGEFFWAHLAEPPLEHEQAYPIGAALLRAGETVTLTDDALGVPRAPVWVWTIEAGPGARAKLKLRGPWAGAFAWDNGAGTALRRVAYGQNLLALFEGWPVARLSRSGSLRLAGRLRERATLPDTVFTQPIAVSGGWLYLGVGADDAYHPFMRIDTAGNAELAGTVRERSGLAMETGGSSVGATPERFWLSPDAQSGALEWRAAESILHLKSILIESVRL
ncbi:hypothetical protein LLG95_04170 [bacterium]|nr:hypothetical protein [bacterium]